jgi:hypothetical protein
MQLPSYTGMYILKNMLMDAACDFVVYSSLRPWKNGVDNGLTFHMKSLSLPFVSACLFRRHRSAIDVFLAGQCTSLEEDKAA